MEKQLELRFKEEMGVEDSVEISKQNRKAFTNYMVIPTMVLSGVMILSHHPEYIESIKNYISNLF